MILRQSTAVDVLIGPFVDLTNGYTAEAGETPSVLLSVNGQSLGARSDATPAEYDDAGYYNCELDTTDTATVGTLVLAVEETATARAIRHEYTVVEETTYDALYKASATGFTSLGEINLIAATQTSIDAIETYTGTTLDTKINTIDTLIDAITASLITAAGEPAQGTPGQTLGTADKVSWLYKYLINKKTQTATQFSLRDFADTQVDTKATITDDGTTLTYGAQATGP